MKVLTQKELKRGVAELAKFLFLKQRVEFKHNNLYYEVFKSADGGYVVNVYSDKKDAFGEYRDESNVDGGLCIGSAKDAIEFML